MPDRTDPVEQLIRSWNANAVAWTKTVRSGGIASRKAATDAAIVSSIVGRRPRRVLDIGCGEGWLVRRLAQEPGCATVGLDGCASLIAAARASDPGGDYRDLTYAEFIANPDAVAAGVDVAVFNYALLESRAVDLLSSAASRLAPGGVVIVQTLHPWASAGGSYRDGWRTEDFSAFASSDEVWAPMPWYFRTLESWLTLISDAGLALETLREPAGDNGAPLSLLMVAARTA